MRFTTQRVGLALFTHVTLQVKKPNRYDSRYPVINLTHPGSECSRTSRRGRWAGRAPRAWRCTPSCGASARGLAAATRRRVATHSLTPGGCQIGYKDRVGGTQGWHSLHSRLSSTCKGASPYHIVAQHAVHRERARQRARLEPAAPARHARHSRRHHRREHHRRDRHDQPPIVERGGCRSPPAD
jgi:hypothetical protein